MLGIGGNTIEEAQQNLSSAEFFSWVQYRNKRGPLSIAQRIDRAAAIISISQVGGRMEDYMPWSSDIEDKENTMEIEESFRSFDKDFKIDTSRKVEISKRKMLNLDKAKDKNKGEPVVIKKSSLNGGKNSERFIKR